jgi:hypothetical protein
MQQKGKQVVNAKGFTKEEIEKAGKYIQNLDE